MSYELLFADGDGSEDESTLFSLSGEFFEAASVLRKIHPTRINYSIAIYYLLGHAAELMLKALLYTEGLTAKDLKKIGHDLSKLIEEAQSRGVPNNIIFTHIAELSEIYKSKNLEYRTNKSKTFPNVDELSEEVKKLQDFVFGKIFIRPSIS